MELFEEEAGVGGIPSFVGFNNKAFSGKLQGYYQIFKNEWLILNGEFSPYLKTVWLRFKQNNKLYETLYGTEQIRVDDGVCQYKLPNAYKTLRDFLPVSCLGKSFIRDFKIGAWVNFDACEINADNIGKIILSHSCYYNKFMVNILLKFNSNNYHAKGILGQTFKKTDDLDLELFKIDVLQAD
jgi:hypothetical protein